MVDPVSIVATPIVKTVIDKAISLVGQNFQLLRGVEEDVKKLSSKLSAIQSVLEDAEKKQLADRSLRDWLGKLQEASHDADDILKTLETEAYLLQQKQQVLNFPRKIAYKFDDAKEIKGILERLDDIAKEKEQFQLNVNVSGETSESSRQMGSYVVESDVVGREDEKNEIVDQLLSQELDREGVLSVIPIIGMGGLGKTTLAQLVYWEERVKSHFEFRMWVSVTVNFNYSKVVKEMIEYHSEMRYDINSLSDSQLESRLLDFLAGKCFLLVLDDVWIESYNEWDKLKRLLRRGGKGSRVLVTGRNVRLQEVMGTQPDPYCLKSLPEDQCWLLFSKIVFEEPNIAGHVRASLEEIGRKIVLKCKQLPLAVKAMGGILRGNNDADKWQKILEHEIWEVEEHNSTNTGKPIVLPALKLSYDHLPSHLKQCFAHCYIIPKGYVIDKGELVKFWKAESFILSKEGYTVDEIGSDYFDELLMRSFFQPLEVDKQQQQQKRYRMHDLIHDLARSVSSPHCHQVKDNHESSCPFSERSRHVSLLCKDVEKPVLEIIQKSKRLHTLLFPSDYLKDFGQALDKIFNTFKFLHTLDLSSSTVTELPNSVEKLKLLHYLDLSRTEIRALPSSICSLYNLQTLKLLGCLWLFKLPKDLGNLVNLQHLELDDMFWFKSSASTLPPRMGSLTSLQNLHAFEISRKSGYGIEELKNMKCLQGPLHISKLENAVNAAEANLKDKKGLKKLVFEWSINKDGGPQPQDDDEAADHERMLEHLQPHSNLQVLQILCYRGTTFPSWVREGLLQNLVDLSLNHCSKCKTLPLGQLYRLRNLDIKGMLELEEWPEVVYPSLHRMKISNCPKLKNLPSFFPAMKVLKVKQCDSLKTLPLAPSLMFLTLVDNLVLHDWNEMPIRFVNDEGQTVAEMPSCFIHLLELKIINCPKLQALPQHFYPQKLEISGCQLLSTLPDPEHSRRLQHLVLDACPGGSILTAIPDTSSLYSLVISNISGLTCLPKLPHLSGLKALYIRNCSDLVSLSEEEEEEESPFQCLSSLMLLSIWGCPLLVTLPQQGLPAAIECLTIGSCPILESLGANEMLKNLTSLRDLYLYDCPALRSLPEKGPPTSLQHLHIEGCPLLLTQCHQDSGPDWPKIMDIPDLQVSSTQNSLKKKGAWYHRFNRGKGIDTREFGQQQQHSSNKFLPKDKGQTSKGKMVQ